MKDKNNKVTQVSKEKHTPRNLTDSKQASSKTNIQATPTSPPTTPPKEHTRIAPKPKLSFVGDSNARNLSKHLYNTKTDNAVWVNAGCKMEDVKSQVHHMNSSSK